MRWSETLIDGTWRFVTGRLRGTTNERPIFREGLFTTLRRSVLAHAGEAFESRRAFDAEQKFEQDRVIEFLNPLQVLPPSTKNRIVDEVFRACA